jgi:multisubunit Na+/H+ antiporter MnhF subunit
MVKTIIIIALIVVVLSMLAMFIRIIKGPTLPDTLYNATHAINCKPIASSARTRSGKVGPLIIRININ